MDIDTSSFIESARKGFGHIEGRTDVECLCLKISHLSNGIYQRNAAWEEVSRLRQQIQKLQSELLTTI